MQVRAFFGAILMVVGALVMLSSGGCSLVFLAATFGQGGSLDAIPLVLIVGGIPFLIGLGLFFGGKSLMRSDDKTK